MTRENTKAVDSKAVCKNFIGKEENGLCLRL